MTGSKIKTFYYTKVFFYLLLIYAFFILRNLIYTIYFVYKTSEKSEKCPSQFPRLKSDRFKLQIKR